MDFWGDRHRGTSEHANRFNIDAQDDCPVRSGQGRLYIETSILFTLYKHVIRVEILLNLEMEAKTFGCHWKIQVSCNHPTGSWFEVVVCLSLVQMIRNKVRRARMIFLLFAIMFGQIVVCLQAATHCFSSWEVSFRVSVFLRLLDGFSPSRGGGSDHAFFVGPARSGEDLLGISRYLQLPRGTFAHLLLCETWTGR